MILTASITAYVIAFLNVPLFEQATVPDDALVPLLVQWGVLNPLRIALPGYGLVQLARALKRAVGASAGW